MNGVPVNDLYATLLDHAYDAIFVRDSEACITFWNRGAERLYGWTSADAVGRDAHHLLGSDPAIVNQMRQALADTGTWHGEMRHRRKDGGEVIVDSRQAVIEGGLVLEVNRDITDRHLAERSLRASERLLTGLMNAVTESIWLFDREIVLMANTTAARRVGLTVADVVGRSWRPLLPASITASRGAYLKHVFSSGTPVRFEDERDGVWFDHSFYPVFDTDGTVVAVAGFSADVTERKRAADQFREMTQRLTYHINNSPLAVIEWGPDMRLTRWSAEAERLFGWSADEVLGKTMFEFRWIHDEDLGQVRDVSRDLETGVNPQRFSTMLFRS